MAEEAPEPAEDARPAAAKEAAAAETGSGAAQDEDSSYEYETSEEQEEPAVVVRRYQDGEIGAIWENPSSGRYGSARKGLAG